MGVEREDFFGCHLSLLNFGEEVEYFKIIFSQQIFHEG